MPLYNQSGWLSENSDGVEEEMTACRKAAIFFRICLSLCSLDRYTKRSVLLAKQIVIEFRLRVDGNAKEFLRILVIQAPSMGRRLYLLLWLL